jgi:uncharacterized protein YecT (DUF1311 family)
MTTDPYDDAWRPPGAAGQSTAGQSVAGQPTAGQSPPRDPPPTKPKWRLPPGRNLILGGVAGALATGLAFGLASRPQFVEPADRRPMQPVTPVPVEVLPPTPMAMPKPGGRLEVLPPDMARRAGESATIARAEVVEPGHADAAEAVGEVVVARAAEPVRPTSRPSFDCADARSRSEAMVCADPELAAADRRLGRAYARAIDAGVPARALRAEQDDWLAIREDAARRSPAAVASIYEQRTQELNELAAGEADYGAGYGPGDEID